MRSVAYFFSSCWRRVMLFFQNRGGYKGSYLAALLYGRKKEKGLSEKKKNLQVKVFPRT